jgi:hypothetical protein
VFFVVLVSFVGHALFDVPNRVSVLLVVKVKGACNY